MAKAEAKMIVEGIFNSRAANILLEGAVGSRTIQAIKARRKSSDHRERVMQWIGRLQEADDPRGIDHTESNNAHDVREPG